MGTYVLKLCGLTRRLPLVAISPKVRIASFNLLGDGELVERLAVELERKIADIAFDYLVGPEVKVVPLIQSLAVRLGKPRYIILRKNIMGYMVRPLTGQAKPTLTLNGPDAELLQGKRVVIVDDVITSGRTVVVASGLIRSAGGEVVAVCAVLKQGDELERIAAPFYFLGKLPFFPPI